MRSSSFLIGLTVLFGSIGCGGTSSVSVAPDERVPATPLPGERVEARGPSGSITMLSIEEHLIATARFVDDAPLRANGTPRNGCSANKAIDDVPERERNVGNIVIQVPTRDGERVLDVPFDVQEKRYELVSVEARVEPGAPIRVSADGANAPRLDTEIRAAANVVFDVPDVLEIDAKAPTDIPVHWTTEGENDEVMIDLSIGDSSVTCFFPSARGEGTIPASLVATLKEATQTTACTSRWKCSLYLASMRARDVEADGWSIVVAHGSATFKDVHVIR